MRLPELSWWDEMAQRHHENNTSGHHGAEITEQRRGHDGYPKALAWMRDGAAGDYLLCYEVDAELTLQKYRKNKSTCCSIHRAPLRRGDAAPQGSAQKPFLPDVRAENSALIVFTDFCMLLLASQPRDPLY
jgi:hypothetical protein